MKALSADEIRAADGKRAICDSLRVFVRHLVGISGAYEHIKNGCIRQPQNPFCYSATTVEVAGKWYLLTAGHNVEKMVKALSRPDMKLVACGLDDTYASASSHSEPIPYFDFESAPRFWKYEEEGPDFGLIYLRDHDRKLLEANGVRPLTEEHWDPNKIDECDSFLMVGFPEDSIHSNIALSQKHYDAKVKGIPSLILIERVRDDVQEAKCPRFVGQIRPEHEVGSIVGMSGGPIFCFKDHDFEPYFAAAIQSTWVECKKKTFGCPMPLIIEAASHFFAGINGDET